MIRATRRSLLIPLAAVAFALLAADVAGAQQGDGEGTQGILQYRSADAAQTDRVPIEGGEVVVYDAELSPDGRTVVSTGEEVGRGTSGADGAFSVDLPGPGDYAVEIQIDTLPEGVALVDEDRQVLALRLATNQRQNVLFNLAEEGAVSGRQTDTFLDRAARLLVEGIKFGLIIGMCAIGLSLIYGTTGLVNFAHSEMITFGAVIAYWFNVTIGMHLIIATLLAMVLGAAFGASLDLAIWRPLRGRGVGLVAMMIISIGLAIFLRYLILYQFGDRSRAYGDYAVQTDPLITFGPISLIPKDVVMIVISLIVLIGVAVALRRTKLGKAMRAVSDNPDLASSTGIDVNRIITLVWMMGGALVTLGAVFQGLSEQVNWLMGLQLLLLIFAGVTLGGLGTDFGAMVGSVIVGALIFLSTLWVAPELKNLGALLVLIVILMIRPQGIFGRKERIG
jgi:branched-chain amino acid transport system permease protein